MVRRSGLPLTPEMFWEMDSWTFAKLYNMELEIIKIEKQDGNDYKEQPDSNDPELNDIVNKMSKIG